ncbi:MarR family transcriptional regulator [Rhodococcus sp. BGS-1C]|uniref:MarR family winged helix-turn-helix transcriptional regulator n=1 Tax=unclassified Rhodococcus (in: high G+C Gram-positive bacteria) TaxID=192944 RepID=UPI0019D0F09B|nr:MULTISPECIES: MarR family transcriptional regulator [unclassified Rhodococcus (in: high G+C Gram-positive bacteria)]MCC8930242.1 MarR family transcriptional regulator [Rhodococcus sp. I2R]
MKSTHWLDREEQRMWRSYLDATRLLLLTLDRQLERDSDISFTDFELLVLLSEATEHRMRMSALAEAVTTSRSGVTRAISRLVAAGWVRRVECENDRRGTLAELTADGERKLAAASPGHVDAVRANMFDLLTPESLETLAQICETMRAHMTERR